MYTCAYLHVTTRKSSTVTILLVTTRIFGWPACNSWPLIGRLTTRPTSLNKNQNCGKLLNNMEVPRGHNPALMAVATLLFVAPVLASETGQLVLFLRSPSIPSQVWAVCMYIEICCLLVCLPACLCAFFVGLFHITCAYFVSLNVLIRKGRLRCALFPMVAKSPRATYKLLSR